MRVSGLFSFPIPGWPRSCFVTRTFNPNQPILRGTINRSGDVSRRTHASRFQQTGETGTRVALLLDLPGGQQRQKSEAGLRRPCITSFQSLVIGSLDRRLSRSLASPLLRLDSTQWASPLACLGAWSDRSLPAFDPRALPVSPMATFWCSVSRHVCLNLGPSVGALAMHVEMPPSPRDTAPGSL